MELGFVGTGNMGNPIALHLIEAGHALRVHDLRPEATTNLEAAGARRVESPIEAARGAAAVFLSLPKPADVEQVVLGADGVLEGLQPGGVIVDMTTNSPNLVRRLAEVTRARGVELLDAPVTGGVGGARRGTLAVLVGGSQEAFERCEPLLQAIGANIFRIGDSGAGNVAKLINNMLVFINIMGAQEALILGARAGVDPKQLWEVVKAGTGNSWGWEQGMRAILRDRLSPPSFTVDLARKDIGLAAELAAELDVPLTLGAATESLIEHHRASGFATEDVLATIHALEERTGTVVCGAWKD
jgi:3-hydroxyisobutyrate dehydrogenase